MKKCNKCGDKKELKDFYKNNTLKDGYSSTCKECKKLYQRNYNKNNKDKRKKYLSRNKEHTKIMKDIWRNLYEEKLQNNPELIEKEKKRQKIYYKKNKKKICKRIRNKRNENLEHTHEKEKKRRNTKNRILYMKKYRKIHKEKNKHVYAWRSLLRNTIIRMNTKKSKKTIDELGYSAETLKLHLESLFLSGMSWNNYGEWHIDHTKSVSLFDKETPVSIVCSFSNLKPMWATTREINGIIYKGNLNKGNNLE